MRTLSRMPWWALTLFALGCPDDQVHFHDDLDFVFDFRPFDPAHPPPDDLHSPYVTGARFRIYAFRDHDQMDLRGAEAVSMQPGVLDVWNTGSTREVADFDAEAIAPGEAEIVLYRSSRQEGTWGRAVVEVADPVAVDVTFAGALFIDAAPEEYRVGDTVQILQGGMGTFLVEYRDARGRRLSGNDVLQVESLSPGLEARDDQTYFAEDREWIRLRPTAPGLHQVRLSAAGRTLRTLTVRAVQPEEVEFIELRPESERGAHGGDFLAVLAVGYRMGDGGPEPIYGIEYDWAVNGFDKPGQGDLYKYEYDRNERSTLEVRYRDMEQRTTIHGDWSDGWVDSTNHIGCQAGRGRDLAGFSVILLGALAALLVARRPRRSPRGRS
ncbi:hypothetical protein KBD49_15050 [Myxococcota bacterium]|nr:hypothetical protein [Myxococcota bacterium]